jgi:hypothetical protein
MVGPPFQDKEDRKTKKIVIVNTFTFGQTIPQLFHLSTIHVDGIL